MSDSQRAVICPGPSFAGASLSGKRHHKTTHWMNGDFQNRTFLLKRTTMPAMCSKLWSTIILKKHRLYQKRAKNIAWGGVHALHDLQVRGDCLELLFLIYIRALALVEHHPSFRPEFLPRPTVSYFPDRLYRICNWQMGVGRFLGFLQVLMAVQWLLELSDGLVWHTEKHRFTETQNTE